MYKRILYIVGPFSSGKTTIMDILQQRYGYEVIKSTTTRTCRNEEDKNMCNFVSTSTFSDMIKRGEFLEHATYACNSYGTTIRDVTKSVTDSPIAVKIIEVEGLLKIIQSGFHERYDIDFCVACIRPEFDDYEDLAKLRHDWVVRTKEDKILFDKLKLFFDGDGKKYLRKFKVFRNKDDVCHVAADINRWCVYRCNNHLVEFDILKLPHYVTLSKENADSKYSVSFIDCRYPIIKSTLFMNINGFFDTEYFFKSNFESLVSYSDDDYIVINLSKFGVIAIINKEV